VLFIREIDLEKSVRILAILSDKEGSRIGSLFCFLMNRARNRMSIGTQIRTRVEGWEVQYFSAKGCGWYPFLKPGRKKNLKKTKMLEKRIKSSKTAFFPLVWLILAYF
jgi:hypothetical protein